MSEGVDQDQQTKRHHYVPKAYLKAFCNEQGRLLVYRKDEPRKPLHVKPDATHFRRFYYSQPTPEGAQDNNRLERFFSKIESRWPTIVARLHQRDDVNDELEQILEFMALQRARVPACRDAAEAMMAQTVKDTMKVMLASGQLEPPPAGYEDLPDRVQVAIDPHRSIHAMASAIQGMGKLFSMLGFMAVHNRTARPFLSSDNPVLWFDPSLSFSEQRPYTVNPEGGPAFLIFPVSPRLALMGSSSSASTFAEHGLLHSDAPDEEWVDLMNIQICRFAYESVVAQRPGHEEMIEHFAGVSPVHEALPINVGTGMMTIHRQAFGPRAPKPRWTK